MKLWVRPFLMPIINRLRAFRVFEIPGIAGGQWSFILKYK